MSSSTLACIADTQPAGELSDAQKDFATLTGMLEATQVKLETLKQLAQAQSAKKMAALTKLENKELALKRQIVLFLDERVLERGLTQKQREIAGDVLLQMATDLLETNYGEGIAAVIARQTESLPVHEAADHVGSAEDMNALFEALEAQMAAQQQASEFAREAAKSDFKSSKNAGKKSSPKSPLAANDPAQTLKSLYRKLSSALHPDRESDPHLREEKSKLMVEANKAYADKDLFKLLKLQIKAQPYSQSLAPKTTSLDDQLLQHMNQMLRQQLSDALGETRDIEHHIRGAFGLHYGAAINTQTLGRALKQNVEAFLNHLITLEQDVQFMQASDPYLKQWLKDAARGMSAY